MSATATETSRVVDQERAEAFAERLVGVLNDGALAVMISVGHRTGLFDQMADGLARDSHALADRAGLNERYVREWLAAMLAGGVVEHAGGGAFRLPPEHARWLTRAVSPDNIAVTCQFIPMLGQVEDAVIECFRNGGGVPYEQHPRFHAVMEEDSAQTVVAALEDAILPLVPGLTRRLDEGIDVLDLGCGRGRALLLMAQSHPASRFTGIDLSADAVAHATERASAAGLSNLRFIAADLSGFDNDAEPEAYDLVTAFDAVHDQAHPLALLRGVRRSLRPGGVFLMQDVAASSEIHENADHPLGALLYAVSTMHCMTVSLAQGGEGLGTMWGIQRAQALLQEAGFPSVSVGRLEHDMFNAYFVARP
jgi:SAM-dependent methyltransferase